MTPTRRQFLVASATASGTALLAACAADSPSTSPATNPGDTAVPAQRSDGTELPKAFAMVQRFPNHPLFIPGQEERLPVSIMKVASNDQNGGLRDNGPETIEGWIEDFNQVKITDVVATRHFDGIANAYWVARATLPKAVVYTLRLKGDDGYGATFEVFDPTDVVSPATGTPMPAFDTPTKDNHRGVEPYCTLAPKPCPFHEVTLADALKSGKPVAYMVGTPAHCTTGTCSPGLQFLIAESTRVGDAMVCVHADVYSDEAATEVAPAVAALGVQYEPIIYFIDATGVIVDRLDGIWDKSELRERVELLLS
ncbi:MAG: hypothetical protein F2681_06755 [Actinobacteria bacterium]|uniref:Unannotated protein n=1 Tax=freshwater metagenome TaxID=449393 RepID=A0A6J7HU58_9ZZZZ|nr:hypothetical protein [Actinomycetota bacterium]MSW76919.1 hypothetical protein [Actinomycetota bacterium]MSX55516.1 hypothetical protein [Actinomycetota bacterium]MSX92346.1 hypothetical protein [Actinomycetota bacterium]MSZ82825.1 hypothetical protein [Actinomycetota bacterium]